ncbi:MAG: PQQ-binding-like beta-propeller repeat protein [Gemmatales bacterium]|nr:PQQ-binding-like beta-propeller repeat protein [Gemmatales bacterium]MDW8174895.1 PQQ-binding-like beta-propeller repeat protein [Gemmatales bacterium]
MSYRCSRCLVLVLAFACTSVLPAATWPRFRGPNGEGTAPEADLPLSWKGPEEATWKVALPGEGNSSPVIWEDRLFVQSASADGRQRFLIALRPATGQVLWTRSWSGKPAAKHRKNTFASNTPATDGQRVYALFWTGESYVLVACDLEGKTVWEKDLGTYTSQHGAGHSPIVHEGKVILANDQDGTSVLLAFEAGSGQLLWQAPRKPFRACYSTPFVLQRPGRSAELIVASTAGITAYDLSSGRELWHWEWRFEGMPLRTVASPILAQGLILATSGDGGGSRHAVALRPGDKGAVPDSHVVWENKRFLPYVPTLLARGEYVFFVNDAGIAGCIRAATGERVWMERLEGGGSFSASPILVGERIYAVSEEGEVFVFAARPTFRTLGRGRVGEQVFATPAVADGRLFIRGRQHLFCFAAPSNKPR